MFEKTDDCPVEAKAEAKTPARLPEDDLDAVVCGGRRETPYEGTYIKIKKLSV